jgi:hypothetical protein
MVTMRLVGIPSALGMCYKAAGGRLGRLTGLPPCGATDDTAPGPKGGSKHEDHRGQDRAPETVGVSDTDSGSRSWWDGRLFGRWLLVNGVAFLVIPVVGVLLEHVASKATESLVHDHRALAVVITALVGAGAYGVILGRWQWRLLRRRVPGLSRRRWMLATLVPAFAVWLLVIAPEAVDALARGGDTLSVFANGFVQALVLGPLIGLSQATALRAHSTRWAWWLAANIVTYLSGSALYELGRWLQDTLSLPGWAPPYFPVVAIAIHGAWMLWVTAPAVIREARSTLPRDGGDEADRSLPQAISVH